MRPETQPAGVDVAPDDSEEQTTQQQSMLRRILPKLLISLVVGGAFAWFVHQQGVPIVPGEEAFSRVRWWTIPTYVAALLVTHFFRASRWRFLIAPVKKIRFREVILLNWIGFFAIFALPLRLGELARPALTKLRQGVPLSVGMGTVAVERVIDGLVTSLCVAWALFALPRIPTDDKLAQAIPYYGYLLLAVFVAAFAALGLFLWQQGLASRITRATVGLVSERLGELLARKVRSVADGVRSIGDLRLGSAFLFETILYWGTNALGMWLLAWGCGIPLEFGHAVALMGILAIGILLPAGPGLFGNFQAFISSGLSLYFASSIVGEQGAVYIFLLYILQTVVICLTGLVPLYALKIPFSALLRVGKPS